MEIEMDESVAECEIIKARTSKRTLVRPFVYKQKKQKSGKWSFAD